MSLVTGMKNAMCSNLCTNERMMHDVQCNHSFGKDCPNFQCSVDCSKDFAKHRPNLFRGCLRIPISEESGRDVVRTTIGFFPQTTGNLNIAEVQTDSIEVKKSTN